MRFQRLPWMNLEVCILFEMDENIQLNIYIKFNSINTFILILQIRPERA